MLRRSLIGRLVERIKGADEPAPWTSRLADGSRLDYRGETYIKTASSWRSISAGTKRTDGWAADACADGGTIASA